MASEFGTTPPIAPGPRAAAEDVSQQLAGLDALDLSDGGRGGSPLARRAWRSLWPKLAALALVGVIWELLYLGHYKPYVFPGPGASVAALGDQVKTGLLWHAIATTLRRALIGFALATLIGSVVGALVSRIAPLRAAIGSLITGLQTMPSIAWFPFAIILFGINTEAILFVIVLGAAPSIANGLIAGVDYTPPLLLKAGTMMGLRRWSLYRHLILPASLPSFVAGLKQGWAFSWRSLMAGELLVIVPNQPSIGVLLNTYQDQTDMPDVVAIMVVILIIGLVVDNAFGRTDHVIRRRWGLITD